MACLMVGRAFTEYGMVVTEYGGRGGLKRQVR